MRGTEESVGGVAGGEGGFVGGLAVQDARVWSVDGPAVGGVWRVEKVGR